MIENHLIDKAFKPFLSDKAQQPAAVVASEKPTAIKAKLNYTEVGVCPYCNTPMSKTIACDQQIYICHSDRFVSPLPNQEG